ncbi:MAG TPA: ABC transporter permease [Lachnoclostridium phocaeense]|uniref:ABC transporter permease n=1 Tax=Lachnoclostridium phocaeense TaxID=1871021 RepID=A0A921I4A6_9FIRM|nr:ABC transporter permease [Lachnoclostridium phocaeense]HJF95002.1 ABC transporter permease [Lachnoclostridium phocaeense]
MNGIKQIFGKEMARILKDKKMVFSVFLLPVLIMVVLLTIINNLAGQMQSDIEEHKAIVWMQNEPDSFETFLASAGAEYDIRTIASDSDRGEAEDAILNGDADLLIEFPVDFDAMIAGFQEGDAVPQIKTYYNPSEEYSSQAYQEISVGVLESYRQTLLAGRVGNPDAITVFTVNSDNDDMVIQDDEKASGQALGMMLPYFITILLFAGAMGIGTDMIAGEKERGTMASLLVAPVKRSSIVLGKVFALMVVSGISSLVYVAGMVICTPFMMDSMTGMDEALNLNLGPDQILMLGLLLVAIAFLYSAVVALISVFAKTTKEASSYIMPVYMVVLVVGLLTMFRMGDGGPWDYYIPFYNSAIALQAILSHELTMSQYLITLVETLALGGILTVLIARAFNNEKVMAL